MLPQKYSAEIFYEDRNKDLLIKLIQQLNKDYDLIGVNKSFEEHLSIQELIYQLNSNIEYLIKNDFNAYLNLLYRIDIPESKVKNIGEIETEKIAHKVTSLVLIREWQKVWFKSKNL